MKNPFVAFLLAVAAVAVPAKAQYSTHIWKADSLFLCGEYAQSSAMFDKAFQSERDIQGQHLYNAACVAALSGDADKAFRRLFARLEKEPGWYSETFEQDEGYYLTHQYDKALEAWKQHLAYNPTSIATYYNIANIYAYLQKDDEQAKAYYQQFLDLARKEENPNASLSEMIEKAEELLKYYEAVEGKKAK